MAKLIRNVHVPGHGWYGPAYQQPPAEVAPLITNLSAWEFTAVERAELGELDAAASVERTDRDLAEAKAAVSAAEQGVKITQQITLPDGMTATDITVDKLSDIADNKAALLAYAKAAGIDVDGRLGAKKVYAAIAEAMKNGGPKR